jgi:hypothetical protein
VPTLLMRTTFSVGTQSCRSPEKFGPRSQFLDLREFDLVLCQTSRQGKGSILTLM